MELNKARVLLTGATGGIGFHLTAGLLKEGAHLIITGRRQAELQSMVESLSNDPHQLIPVCADVSTESGRLQIEKAVLEHWDNSLDVLINNAGVMDFSAHEEMTPQSIHQLLMTNVEAPMQLTRCFLPLMQQQGSGQIVFLGSILGALGMPYFASYSASKFAMRGFSEALRRELASSGIEVVYVGPRSVDTAMNSPSIRRMAEATGMQMDKPEWVAKHVVDSMRKGRKETHLGVAESIFARINRVWPSLVDIAMGKQQKQIQAFVKQS